MKNEYVNQVVAEVKEALLEELEGVSDSRFPLILNKGELQEFLGLERATINALIAQCDKLKFPVIRREGKQDRFPREAVKKWVTENYAKIQY